MIKFTAYVFFILLSYTFFIGCGGSNNKVMEEKNRPEWVNGSLPMRSDMFFAMGSANIGANVVLARKKAEDDARIELGKILKIKINAELKKFTDENVNLVSKDINSSEVTSEISNTVTEAVLIGSQISDRWEDPDRNLFYALASMPKISITNEILNEFERKQDVIFDNSKEKDGMKKIEEELEKWDFKK